MADGFSSTPTPDDSSADACVPAVGGLAEFGRAAMPEPERRKPGAGGIWTPDRFVHAWKAVPRMPKLHAVFGRLPAFPKMPNAARDFGANAKDVYKIGDVRRMLPEAVYLIAVGQGFDDYRVVSLSYIGGGHDDFFYAVRLRPVGASPHPFLRVNPACDLYGQPSNMCVSHEGAIRMDLVSRADNGLAEVEVSFHARLVSADRRDIEAFQAEDDEHRRDPLLSRAGAAPAREGLP